MSVGCLVAPKVMSRRRCSASVCSNLVPLMRGSSQMRPVSSRLVYAFALAPRPMLHRLPRGETRIVKWLGLRRLVNPQERIGRIAGGSLIQADLRDRIQCQMYWLGIYERPETRWLLSQLREGDVFIDVGAHVGYYTLLAASRVGPTGAVHAFEPLPDNCRRLERNVKINQYWQVITSQCAVSDETAHSAFAPPAVVAERGWG